MLEDTRGQLQGHLAATVNSDQMMGKHRLVSRTFSRNEITMSSNKEISGHNRRPCTRRFIYDTFATFFPRNIPITDKQTQQIPPSCPRNLITCVS